MRSLTLSGWTQPADALHMLDESAATFDYSEYASAEASFAGLKKFADMPFIIAWSMGGQLALRAITAGILRPRHLTLIATPYHFVGASLARAMGEPLFDQFRANYANDPARTKTRFHGLIAKGDGAFSRVLGALRHHAHVEDTSRWLPWLEELGRFTLAGSDLSALPPTLIVHGKNDAIVPYEQGVLLADCLPRARLEAWEETGHAPHVQDPARLRATIAAHRAACGVAA